MSSKGRRITGSLRPQENQATQEAHGTHGTPGTLARRTRGSNQPDTARQDDGFLVVTIASVIYLLFALTYNARLLETVSVGASLVDLELIENFGTVLAGAGVSLLAWRLRQRLFARSRLWPVITCIVLSVPLMWGLQEWTMRSLVGKATPGELRSSYVASLATDGLRTSSSPLKNFEWLSDGQHDHDVQTFFALFPALAHYDTGLVAAIETELPNLVRHTVERREGSVDARFRDYENEEFRFNHIYNESYASPAQRSTTNLRQNNRLETERAKRPGAAALPVVPASLPPGLSWQQFSKRDDIRESFARRMGYHTERLLDFGMQRNEFIERVYEPMVRLRETDMLRPLNTAGGFEPGSDSRERGMTAYRAALEPVVSLAFSFFFALLNAVVLVASIVFRSLPVRAKKGMKLSIAERPI